MKFQLPSVKHIFLIIGTLAACIIIGLLLLVVSYAVFPDEAIVRNAKDSTMIFRIEGPYPSLDGDYTSELDNYTDSIMLKQAAYDGKENAIEKALISPKWILTDKLYEWPTNEFVAYYEKDKPEPRTVSSYARYWHGYLIGLRPAFMLNNYGQIRTLNLYIQITLTLLVIVLMVIKKCWQAIPAYLISVLMIGIYPTACSLQFSTVFYLVSFLCIAVLLFNNKIKSSNGRLLFFVIAGATTSFMDFLTYPLATFTMTAALFLGINCNDNKQTDIRNILNFLICWLVGYAGMWAGKWILSTVFTNQNIIKDAIDSIRFRSSNDIYGEAIEYKTVIEKNVEAYTHTPFFNISLWMIAIEVIILLVFKNKTNWKMVVSCLFISILPFAWYAITGNHSYVHFWFTNKIFMGSTFALLLAFACWNPQRFIKREKKEKK